MLTRRRSLITCRRSPFNRFCRRRCHCGRCRIRSGKRRMDCESNNRCGHRAGKGQDRKGGSNSDPERLSLLDLQCSATGSDMYRPVPPTIATVEELQLKADTTPCIACRLRQSSYDHCKLLRTVHDIGVGAFVVGDRPHTFASTLRKRGNA